MNKNITAEGAAMGTTTHNHKEHTTTNAPFHSAFFESLHKEQWQRVKLGEIAEIISGGTPKTSVPEYWGGDIAWLSVADFNNGRKYVLQAQKTITELGLKNSNTKILNQGDIIISARGTVGVVAMLKKPMAFNQTSYGITSKGQIDNNFIYYVLKNASNCLIQNSYGAVFDTITKPILDNLEISLPPLETQHKIAEILSSLDDKIDLLHRQNKTLESLALTLFRHTFIDNPNRNEWQIGKLGDWIEIFDNKRIPLSKLQRDKMKAGTLYPYYGAANIMDYVNDFIFDGAYILMGEDGTVETEDGYPILQYASGKFWVNNHAHIFKAKAPYNDFFILNFLKQTNISHIVTGAVQPKINQENLKSIPFYKYPIELVSWFIETTNTYFDKINANKKQIQNLQSMRDILLAKILTWEAYNGHTISNHS